jgi:hypothetical protein
MNRALLRSAWVSAIGLAAASVARGAILQVVATGFVTSASDPQGLLEVTLPEIGSPVSFSITLDTTAQDGYPQYPQVGAYLAAAPVQMTIGEAQVAPGTPEVPGLAVILDGLSTVWYPPPGDQWSGQSTSPCLPSDPGICRRRAIVLNLSGPDTEFTSDALVVPAWPSGWSTYEYRSWITYSFLQADNPTGSGTNETLAEIRASVASLTVSEVPVPAAAWFLPAAFAAAGLRARRR